MSDTLLDLSDEQWVYPHVLASRGRLGDAVDARPIHRVSVNCDLELMSAGQRWTCRGRWSRRMLPSLVRVSASSGVRLTTAGQVAQANRVIHPPAVPTRRDTFEEHSILVENLVCPADLPTLTPGCVSLLPHRCGPRRILAIRSHHSRRGQIARSASSLDSLRAQDLRRGATVLERYADQRSSGVHQLGHSSCNAPTHVQVRPV